MDHPTAERVHARVRKSIPTVSLGTVYRNLQKLAAQERIRVLHGADRAARYDAVLEEHDHFLCERCGAVTDVSPVRGLPVASPELARAGYSIRAQRLTFYGVCPRCLEGKRRTRRRRDAAS
jgi:Fur family transcriptional regulator, peroxide stress response regulator